MKFSKLKLYGTAVFSSLLLATAASQAGTINYISLADGGALGESAWENSGVNTLIHDIGGGETLTVTGFANGNDAYAYLDANNAGLGVAAAVLSGTVFGADPGNTSNKAAPSSDDNVRPGQSLVLTFSTAVDVMFWFSNNHDGGFGAGDAISIDGIVTSVSTGYVGGGNGISWSGTELTVAHHNEEFYISGLEVAMSPVPEPSTFALLGLGLGVLGYGRRKRA